ncbi:MAG: hypothetical protein L0Z62_46210 [Gemmataceae bacterium]|nr:hypothetical protein [Gemmataceae bacterium]
MECEYDYFQSPTRPDQVDLLRRLCGRDERSFQMYLCTEQHARARGFSGRWWRKGAKERLDKASTRTGGRSFKAVTAYDGNVVRELSDGHEVVGSINTVEGAHWNDSFRLNPFVLLYEVFGTPCSKIIGDGQDYAASRVMVGGKPHTHIFVNTPTGPPGFTFLFDDNHRLIEQGFVRLKPTGKKFYECQKTFLSDYRSYKDGSGETIWFPHKATLRYYTDPFPDGRVVEYTADTITFKKVRFNVEIPDDHFVIDLPPDAKVYDGVTGQGWLPASAATTIWTDPPRPGRSKLWLVVGVGVGVMLTIGVALWAWRKRVARRLSVGGNRHAQTDGPHPG